MSCTINLKNEFWNVLKANPEIGNLFKEGANSLETAIKGILFADTSDKFIANVAKLVE